ncbi:MAG: hypothetical protein K8L97_27780 [Anaerolineae bacterium]|nr:hypothetical protein [Anaerolineae bacterium]
MAFDFEALVGHLYVVGGRSISVQPPGLLVEVAPKKAARGRELDTFFVLVTPSGDNTAPSAFYDQMANVSAERYFNSTGSVTAGLRAVFGSLNQDLSEHNRSGKRPYEANIVCAVLRDDELFLARVGAGVALVKTAEEVQAFPTDFSNDDALFGPPLGVHPVPDIKMSRYTISEGTRVILSDAHLADLDYEKTTSALGSSEINEVINGLKDLNAQQATVMVVEFVPPEAPSPTAVKDTRSSTRPPETPTTTTQTSEVPVVAPDDSRSTRRRAGLPAPVERGAGTFALFLSRIMGGINYLLDRIMPQPQESGRGWMRATTATGIAVLIPVAIVVLVVVLGLGRVDQSAFELCVEGANETTQIARSIASSDVAGTLAAWNAVIAKVDSCNDIRAGDPSLAALTREAQNVIDALFQVDRRTTSLIASFTNAQLTQVVLQGLDLYALDSQNQLVYRVTLEQNGRRAVRSTGDPISSMRLGAVIGPYRVGRLIDIAWWEDTTQIVALDETGLLIQCSPRFLQTCEAQQLLGAEFWGNPTRLTFWQGRIYLLDPGANQIWRYDSSGGTFANPPLEYFSGTSRPDITSAVDFGIDDKGSVYLLLAGGLMTKWVSGEQTPFAFANFPEGQGMPSADAMFLDSSPISQGMYIISRGARTVYETTLAGTFSYSYRAANEDDFASLNNLVADANQQVVYALSGNAIFVFEKSRTPPTS